MAKIVLIEDDETVRFTIGRTLEALGHTLRAAGDGRRGLQLVDEFAPDLVITDLLMPGMDGVEILMALRHYQPAPAVVAMTGGGCLSREQFLEVARQLGARAILCKPFSADDLNCAVGAALNTARSSENTPGP